ncbi:chaperone DnaJ 3 [Aureococcus anophagefferens]|nr:chaperone DnaJ 3 [Aureococcus anophagefferens]
MRPAAALLCVLAGAAALRGAASTRSPRARRRGGDDGGYYAALGVSRDASAGDIARAYRRRSLACHPDKGGDAEQFKKLNEAKEVLGDAEKRRAYDRFGVAGVDPRAAPGGGGFGGAGNVDARTAAMFEQMFGSFGSAFGEAFGGGGGVFGGGGFGRGPRSRRFAITLREAPHARFRRRGADLLLDATVPLAEALGGGPVVRVERPDGTTFALALAPAGAVLKHGSHAVEGEGMPVRGAPSRGTLFVRVLVAFPRTSRSTTAVARAQQRLRGVRGRQRRAGDRVARGADAAEWGRHRPPPGGGGAFAAFR